MLISALDMGGYRDMLGLNLSEQGEVEGVYQLQGASDTLRDVWII